MSRRSDRYADLVRAELSELILRRVRDPRVRLATVTEVDVSPDLKRALVRVSVLGDPDEQESALAGLKSARGFLRSALARSLTRAKAVPELHFELDRGAEHSRRISDILESLHGEDDEDLA